MRYNGKAGGGAAAATPCRSEVKSGENISGFSTLFHFSTLKGPYFRVFHDFPGGGLNAK